MVFTEDRVKGICLGVLILALVVGSIYLSKSLVLPDDSTPIRVYDKEQIEKMYENENGGSGTTIEFDEGV